MLVNWPIIALTFAISTACFAFIGRFIVAWVVAFILSELAGVAFFWWLIHDYDGFMMISVYIVAIIVPMHVIPTSGLTGAVVLWALSRWRRE